MAGNDAGRFEGRVAVVTGASSGLGQAVARSLRAGGARVFGAGRDEAKLRATLDGPETGWLAADLTDPAACTEVVRACADRFGGIDILVNAAGAHTMRHTGEVTDDQWQHDLAVNLSAPFFLSRAALPHLLDRNGCIVNVASIAGLEGQAYSAGYCAAKHGLIGLTRAMALEFDGRPIRINAVCPGGMTTPMLEHFTFPENPDYTLILKTAAARGLMDPAQVANVITFLCSAEAAMVHGAVYTVDNGKMAL
ncbi:SDR family NAD(P)-dependent oxidoreductase [Nocardia seriolae]|uniref:Oxidoreductase n=1 Tax=Nocardia seriolae TaxID=37332 RepID=A0A0B8NBU9_9NOCA|nr:SDR family oxidoreductase [Nocardia seriolae]APA98027.1 putative oxidoreductase [Nocardia seriolae]MTJ62727.1 SDR family oxidoreductase [Nocardia seriolae]MTJ74427.1 SDR family oxidoreductase [Nocardia seriolae]MTJ87763.1 SDR family oxidoreductase [Nocardia seriolae]MTK31756.1 SDR family oxidoreductase [Nocardia seriolae]